MDGSPEGDLAKLVVLLALAAFFSASEAAFLALSRSRARQMSEQRLWGARMLLLLYRHRPLALTVMLLGITLSNYMAERVATTMAVQYIDPRWGPLVAVVIMTIVIVVFCEVVPIQLGAGAPDRVARHGAMAVTPAGVLLLPVVVILSFISRGLLYVVGVRTGSLLPGVSEEHLKAMIEQSEEQGVLEAGERRMMHGVLDFGDRTAAQIMTPRPHMVCVEAEQTLREALELGLQEHHSRLPVYDDTPDDIIGVLHLKDLLPYLIKDEMEREARVVARVVHHVPEGLPADELLRQLQSRREMLAVVKDEYGGTAGLVTVEDLLEEIVGDIVDEYDVEEPEIVEVSETELLCDARIGLYQLQDYVHEQLPADEYESLGGFIFDIAGRIPSQGESFIWNELTLTVEKSEGPRLERIRVTLPTPTEPWHPRDAEDDE